MVTFRPPHNPKAAPQALSLFLSPPTQSSAWWALSQVLSHARRRCRRKRKPERAVKHFGLAVQQQTDETRLTVKDEGCVAMAMAMSMAIESRREC